MKLRVLKLHHFADRLNIELTASNEREKDLMVTSVNCKMKWLRMVARRLVYGYLHLENVHVICDRDFGWFLAIFSDRLRTFRT